MLSSSKKKCFLKFHSLYSLSSAAHHSEKNCKTPPSRSLVVVVILMWIADLNFSFSSRSSFFLARSFFEHFQRMTICYKKKEEDLFPLIKCPHHMPRRATTRRKKINQAGHSQGCFCPGTFHELI